MFYPAHSRSTAVNICYMPWSLDRLALTFQVAEPDEWPGLLFPLYSYHSRWTELTWEEVGEGLFGYGPDDLAGYTFLEQVYPVTAFTQRDMGSHPEAYQQSLQAVEDILAFCEEEGIRAVFYLAPTAEPLTGEELSRLEADLTARGGELWDCNQDVDALGLDLSVDFFDADHFNYRGAEKFSRYLGEHLLSQGLTPTEGEDEALWQQRVEHFNTLRDEADEKAHPAQRRRPAAVTGQKGEDALNFNSIQYLLFLGLNLLVYYLLPRRARNVQLLLASYFFYMCWNPAYALLMLFSTAVTYGCGLLVGNAVWGKRRLWVALSLLLNLGVLCSSSSITTLPQAFCPT